MLLLAAMLAFQSGPLTADQAVTCVILARGLTEQIAEAQADGTLDEESARYREPASRLNSLATAEYEGALRREGLKSDHLEASRDGVYRYVLSNGGSYRATLDCFAGFHIAVPSGDEDEAPAPNP